LQYTQVKGSRQAGLRKNDGGWVAPEVMTRNQEKQDSKKGETPEKDSSEFGTRKVHHPSV